MDKFGQSLGPNYLDGIGKILFQKISNLLYLSLSVASKLSQFWTIYCKKNYIGICALEWAKAQSITLYFSLVHIHNSLYFLT